MGFCPWDRTPHSAGALFNRAPASVGALSETGCLTLQAPIDRTPASAGVLSIERLQVQAFKQTGPGNPSSRVLAQKGPKERGYGEACAVGSWFEGSSTKRGLDLAESSPNGPKRTWERLKAVSPKNSKNGGTGGALHPKTLRKGSMARPSPLSKQSPRETAGEGEEEARTAGGSSTPDGRRRRCDLHTTPRHALTPPESRRRSHLQNPPRKR